MQKNYLSTTLLPETFFIVHKRVPVNVNPKNKTGYSYGIAADPAATRALFATFVRQLPAAQGSAVIIGVNNANSSKIIDIIDSAYELRKDFLTPKTIGISRYQWALKQLLENGFVFLKIQISI